MDTQTELQMPDIDEICRRFSAIYTGAISDVMDEMGYPIHALPKEIQGLAIDHGFAGRALTVEGEPSQSNDPDEIFLPLLRMLGDIMPGDVIVTQPHDSSCAHLGELSCETAKYRGVRGVVIDGGARDIDYILKLKVPVFCRYRTPLDILGRWKLTSYGNPIQIGDVKIRRGDFIVADKDGVIVIPQEITLEVLKRSEEVVSTENLVRKAILQGVHPVDAYQKYGRF